MNDDGISQKPKMQYHLAMIERIKDIVDEMENGNKPLGVSALWYKTHGVSALWYAVQFMQKNTDRVEG